MSTCIGDAMFPNAVRATVRLLRRLGSATTCSPRSALRSPGATAPEVGQSGGHGPRTLNVVLVAD
ncbi:MAG: hypothetical protein KTQ12_06880 [Dermatophilaceae bacterium]|nr:hypothetical protein [Dermatophilaceae bacterium]